MTPLFVDEVSIADGKVDRIESASPTRHIVNIERHIFSLRLECFLAMFAFIGTLYGAVELLHIINWWSWAWAACIALCGFVATGSLIPWMHERLLRSNEWIDARSDQLYIMETMKEFENQFVDG